MNENLFKDIQSVPAGEWVVLSADQTRLVSHHPELPEALRLAETQGEKDGVFFRAVPAWSSWIISC